MLIDEVDTGLHPYTQQQAMLELQRSALRRGLQIIVASHSPVVLDTVPPEARIFLDRDESTGNVVRVPLYRDIFQKALYGQSRDQLSILCEDDVAEGWIRGVLDVLNVEMELRHEDFVIGRNTGKDEFASHIRTLGKFGKLKDFVFVLMEIPVITKVLSRLSRKISDTGSSRCFYRAKRRRSSGYGKPSSNDAMNTRRDSAWPPPISNEPCTSLPNWPAVLCGGGTRLSWH